MVIQRTLNKIEELKERPHEDRRAIALYGALIVSGVLLVGWGTLALRGIASDSQAIAEANNVQAASAAGAIPTATASEEMLYASSTDGYIDLIPESEINR